MLWTIIVNEVTNDLVDQMSNWNWQLFFQAACNLGDQLNETTWRFLKAETLAIALEMSSGGEAKYVDDTGYDLVIGDVKIEVKTVGNLTQRAFTKSLDTSTLRIKNTMGMTQKFEKTFDYLVVANSEPPYLAALTTWEEVYRGHKPTGDAITSKIKKEGLNFLTSEEGEILAQGFPPSDSLKEYVRDGIRDWVERIKRELVKDDL